jgi:hypothetical protein
MSKLKYKVGDIFKHDELTDTIEIVNTHKNDVQPYRIRGDNYEGRIVTERWIDNRYTKIEPKTTKFVDLPNQNKALDPEKYPFEEMTSSFCKMLNEKNKRYGNAALEPLIIVGKHHRLGAKVDEKLSRIMNADELKKNDLADVIGYCFLICKDKGWTNFDDQLD